MPSNFHHPMLQGARAATQGAYWLWRHMEAFRTYMERLWGGADRLTHLHFAYAVLFAFVLHLTAYGIWLLIPRTPVLDIPVRVLNIRLGELDDLPVSAPARPQEAENRAGVERIISKVVEEIKQESVTPGDVVVKAEDKKKAKPVDKAKKQAEMAANLEKMKARSKAFDMRSEGMAVAAPVMSVVEKQYVRENTDEEGAGHRLGGSTDSKAEMVSRYEQLISAWIDKFKPEKVSAVGQPDNARAMVRIRIDRRGNIRYMEMEKGTGFVALDRAAVDTVRRANPVPAVPADYPSGESIEFIVPIVFTK